MAYIRAGRAVNHGRQSFVPGSTACAAIAGRFSLSLTPLFASAAPEKDAPANDAGQVRPALSTQILREEAQASAIPPIV